MWQRHRFRIQPPRQSSEGSSMRRWLVRLGIGAVALVVVLVVGAKLLLRSGFAANKVAVQIQEAVGGPTRVGHLDVGVTGSSLHDLQFLEDGAAEGAPP